ncbi:hypothetical protein GCM10008941_33270 [Rhizomicrobium palustre]
MERAAAPKRLALAGELHTPPHQLDDIRPPEDLFKKVGAKTHESSFAEKGGTSAGRTGGIL